MTIMTTDFNSREVGTLFNSQEIDLQSALLRFSSLHDLLQ